MQIHTDVCFCLPIILPSSPCCCNQENWYSISSSTAFGQTGCCSRGRKVFEARGLNPVDFDLCICKSPNGFRTYFQDIAAAIVPVDVPGSTSANLKSLPFEHVTRPVYPLDGDATAELVAEAKA